MHCKTQSVYRAAAAVVRSGIIPCTRTSKQHRTSCSSNSCPVSLQLAHRALQHQGRMIKQLRRASWRAMCQRVRVCVVFTLVVLLNALA